MHVAPTAHLAVPVATTAPGRHRRMTIAPSRVRRATHVVGRVGSLVSLAALALLGTAVAAGVSDLPSAAERPTVTVTYDVEH